MTMALPNTRPRRLAVGTCVLLLVAVFAATLLALGLGLGVGYGNPTRTNIDGGTG